ncbi:MAG: hypothetical protein CMJ78_12305 [Planctomycetaceae bacterium]|nr:hypothetical protein [Planctomycetaceae bacterium]
MIQSPLRGLVVESNPIDLDLIEIALTEDKSDFRVFHAETLYSATAILESWDCDFVLVSVDSSTELQALKSFVQAAQRQAVIALVSSKDAERDTDLLSIGVQDVLEKVTIDNPNLLVEEISRSIQRSIVRQQFVDASQIKLRKEKRRTRRLRRKCRRLQRMHKTAHRFVDDVSHEFRTPLSVIKEYSSLLNEGMLGELNADQREFVAIIGDRADDLNAMVSDMLDVSRLESGVLGLSRSNTTLQEVVDRVWPVLLQKAEVRGVRIAQQFDDNLPTLYCDPEKIGRVITNLAVNAIKFSRDPGRVRLWARRDSDDDIRIGITDNGPGIDQDQQLYLFERFQQLGTGIQCDIKGLGLGLSIANELVDLNFGRISIESTANEGSTFSFTVPLANEEVVTRRHLKRLRRVRPKCQTITLILMATDEAHDESTYDELHQFIQRQLRGDDLLFRFREDYWLFVLPMSESESTAFVADLDSRMDDANRNRLEGKLPFLQATNIGSWAIDGNDDSIANCVA